ADGRGAVIPLLDHERDDRRPLVARPTAGWAVDHEVTVCVAELLLLVDLGAHGAVPSAECSPHMTALGAISFRSGSDDPHRERPRIHLPTAVCICDGRPRRHNRTTISEAAAVEHGHRGIPVILRSCLRVDLARTD